MATRHDVRVVKGTELVNPRGDRVADGQAVPRGGQAVLKGGHGLQVAGRS